MKSKLAKMLGLVLALGLIAAACGDDSDDSADSPSTTAAAEAPADGEEAASSGSIVDVAVEDGRFTTLVAAVEAAGLAETLSGEGPFTVFAPTDDAFAALPEGTVEGLLEDPEGALTDVLTYHVVAGEFLAEDVVELDGQEVETLNGGTVTVGVTDEGVTLTDGQGNVVNVIITNVEADNGVIHVIDAVLLPAG